MASKYCLNIVDKIENECLGLSQWKKNDEGALGRFRQREIRNLEPISYENKKKHMTAH